MVRKSTKLLIVIFLCTISIFMYSSILDFQLTQSIRCYNHTSLDGIKLPDVLDSERQPRPGKTIFFHETSCPANGLSLELGPRQLCSIETAAKNNPDFDIFVLFASPRYLSVDDSPDIWRLKLTYRNIYFRNNDIWRYAEGSPADKFLRTGNLFQSIYLPVHISDFLRLLSIWRYGGIYMDTDILVKKSFQELPQNFGGIEEHQGDLNNGLLGLDPDGDGHKIGKMFLEDFADNYNPRGWATNGPRLITRILKDVCNSTDLSQVSAEQCYGFKVFPKEVFWAVNFDDARDFFESSRLQVMEEQTKNSYSVHVFNHITKYITHKIGSQSLYDVTAKKHCPLTYSRVIDYL